MNCRDFQNEFEERAPLSRAATLHLDSCANCRALHFKQTKLWEMLGALERVEAPNDFNFQLKARIARAAPGGYQTGFFPGLRYALSLSVAVVFLSVVALSGLYFVDRNPVAPVVVQETPNREANIALPVNSFTNQGEIVSGNQPPAEEIPADESANKKPEVPNKKATVAQADEGGSRDSPGISAPLTTSPNENGPGGGSRDIAGTSKPPIIQQEFNTNQKVNPNENPNAVNKTDIQDLLKFIGIEAKSLKVVSVDENSIAERSGIKIGDVVEAIDGRKITGDALQGKQITVKTLTVLRDGERREIVLRNK